MSLLHIAVLLPLIFALIIPILYRFVKRIHLGWFVLPVPIVLFIYFLTMISITMSGNTVMKTLNWMPHFGMNFNLYVDGLGLLFSLLITGIGSLVVLYSIGYLSKSEQLGNFYCYLLLFMGAMLGVVLSDNLIILYKIIFLMQVLTYNYIFSLNLWLLFCPEWLCFDWSMGCIPIVTINDVRIIFVLIFWLSLAFIIWKIIFMKNLFFFYHIRTRDSKLMNNNNTLSIIVGRRRKRKRRSHRDVVVVVDLQLCLTRFLGGPIGGFCCVAKARYASSIRFG